MLLPFINKPPVVYGNIQAGSDTTDTKFILKTLDDVKLYYIKYNSLFNDIEEGYWFLRLIQLISVPIEGYTQQEYILLLLDQLTEISLKFNLISDSNSNGNVNYLLIDKPMDDTITVLHLDTFSIEPYIPTQLDDGQYIISLYNLASDIYEYQVEFGVMYAKHFFTRTMLPNLIKQYWYVSFRCLVLLQDKPLYKKQIKRLVITDHPVAFPSLTSRTMALITFYRNTLKNIENEHAYKIANHNRYLTVQIYDYMHGKFIVEFYRRCMPYMINNHNKEQGRFYLPLLTMRLNNSKVYKAFKKLV